MPLTRRMSLRRAMMRVGAGRRRSRTQIKGATIMSTRAIAPKGAPCWIELGTTDADAVRPFYSELFGWTAEEPSAEFGGYFMFTKGGVPIAGCMPMADLPGTAWNI